MPTLVPRIAPSSEELRDAVPDEEVGNSVDNYLKVNNGSNRRLRVRRARHRKVRAELQE